jgi:GNAT superfamily N-acetyltransferase
MMISIDPVTDDDRAWVTDLLRTHWGSAAIVTRGTVHRADQLPGFVARQDGRRAGLATYTVTGDEVELVTLNSLVPNIGIGTQLVNAVINVATERSCTRLWLITTNDNTPAQRFYARRGFSIVAVHRDAITTSRRLKPEIPETGINGIPVRDEIELQRPLRD